MYKDETNKILNIIYLAAFALILLGLVAFVLITILKPFDYHSMEKVRHTTIENCLQENKNAKGKQSKYYLLVYAKDDDDNQNIEPIVLEYANYLRHHKDLKDAMPIYLLAYDESMKETLAQMNPEAQEKEGMPIMFVVSDGAVSSTPDKTCSKINGTLSDALDKLKEQK